MARMDDHSKEVFKPPPSREFFTPGTSLLIGIFLLVMISLGVASLLIQVTIVVYLLLLILLTFAGLALELWLLRGELVLEDDGLVEYYPLNRARRFRYAQIFEVKHGKTSDQTFIRYYTLKADGQIDTRRFHGTHLMGVKDNEKLRDKLAQRVTAPPPEFTSSWKPGNRQVVLIVLLLLLVLFALLPYLFMKGAAY